MKDFETQIKELISGEILKAKYCEVVNIIANFPNFINTLQIQHSNDGYYYLKVDDKTVDLFRENKLI